MCLRLRSLEGAGRDLSYRWGVDADVDVSLDVDTDVDVADVESVDVNGFADGKFDGRDLIILVVMVVVVVRRRWWLVGFGGTLQATKHTPLDLSNRQIHDCPG